MLFKIASSLKVSAFLKPSSFFSTAAMSHPLLYKNFPNKVDSSSSFIVKQLEEHEVEEAAGCMAEALASREFVHNNFKIQKERLYEGVKQDLQKAVNSNLGLVCRDKKTNKLAGVIYYEDLKETLHPRVWQENMEKDENWGKVEDFYSYLFNILSPYTKANERNEVLLFKRIAVHPDFTKLGVATNLMFAARYLHPRTTKAKRRLMIASNEKTYNFCKKHGWETIKQVDVKDYNAQPNKEGAFLKEGQIYLMKYEPKEGRTLIQEIKSFFEN